MCFCWEKELLGCFCKENLCFTGSVWIWFYTPNTLLNFPWSCHNQPICFRTNSLKQLTSPKTFLRVCMNRVSGRSHFKVKLHSQSYSVYLPWHNLSGSTVLNPEILAANSKHAHSAEISVHL